MTHLPSPSQIEMEVNKNWAREHPQIAAKRLREFRADAEAAGLKQVRRTDTNGFYKLIAN